MNTATRLYTASKNNEQPKLKKTATTVTVLFIWIIKNTFINKKAKLQ